ncbi:unnamed protein product [Dovyalis caffra]|uniref:Uncharacterized protein n=1 Tax=Dovyalis caffra TaxID=77055 RepID=A0AAV1RFK0_9ROSI|nr:unnamed protein product [Dovyalis caffra]
MKRDWGYLLKGLACEGEVTGGRHVRRKAYVIGRCYCLEREVKVVVSEGRYLGMLGIGVIRAMKGVLELRWLREKLPKAGAGAPGRGLLVDSLKEIDGGRHLRREGYRKKCEEDVVIYGEALLEVATKEGFE